MAHRDPSRLIRRAVLAALYLAVVTPVGALARRFRDPLDRAPRAREGSYWLPASDGRRQRSNL